MKDKNEKERRKTLRDWEEMKWFYEPPTKDGKLQRVHARQQVKYGAEQNRPNYRAAKYFLTKIGEKNEQYHGD